MTKKLSPKYQVWIDARNRHHLSHIQVQMARELGLNPTKLWKIDNHKQESWKLPLPQFIEEIYFKRFKKKQPDNVRSIEETANKHKEKREEKKLKTIQIS